MAHSEGHTRSLCLKGKIKVTILYELSNHIRQSVSINVSKLLQMKFVFSCRAVMPSDFHSPPAGFTKDVYPGAQS